MLNLSLRLETPSVAVAKSDKLSTQHYRNGLLNQVLVDVSEGNFLSEEPDIDGGERLVVGQGPPVREL